LLVLDGFLSKKIYRYGRQIESKIYLVLILPSMSQQVFFCFSDKSEKWWAGIIQSGGRDRSVLVHLARKVFTITRPFVIFI